MKFETKQLKLQIKELTDAGTFEGYASTRAKDLGGDIVAEGAFKRTIELNEGVFPILYFHDPKMPVGISVEMREDGHGLFTKGKLNLDKQIGRDVHSDMKMQIINCLSIGYRTVQSEYDKERDARLIKEVKLYEYSLLTRGFAMQPDAMVTGMKAWMDLRDFAREAALIKEGKREAFTLDEIASLCWTIDTELKVGRRISSASRSMIQNAIDALLKLMGDDKPDDEETDDTGKSTTATPEGGSAGTQTTPSADPPEGHSTNNDSEKRDSEHIHSLLFEVVASMKRDIAIRAVRSAMADRSA